MSPLIKFAVSAAGAALLTLPAMAAPADDTIVITTEAGVRTAVVDAGLYDLTQESERVRIDGVLQRVSNSVCAQPHMNDRMTMVRAMGCEAAALRGARTQLARIIETGQQVAQLKIQVAAR